MLGRALRLHCGIQLHAYAFLSNHFHLLLTSPSTQELTAFMGYLNGNLARELGRLHRWEEKFWGRRYRDIPVSTEEGKQVERLDYILEQACKEGLIASPRDWPGVTCANALLSGIPDRGLWHDRTGEFEARRRGRELAQGEFHSEETVGITPLPCWQNLNDQAYRDLIRERVEAIEDRTRQRHRLAGTRPIGRRAILRARPHHRPEPIKRSPAPRFHCDNKAIRQALWYAYRLFVDAYREAIERFRSGERTVTFPEGSYLPPIPVQAPS